MAFTCLRRVVRAEQRGHRLEALEVELALLAVLVAHQAGVGPAREQEPRLVLRVGAPVAAERAARAGLVVVAERALVVVAAVIDHRAELVRRARGAEVVEPAALGGCRCAAGCRPFGGSPPGSRTAFRRGGGRRRATARGSGRGRRTPSAARSRGRRGTRTRPSARRSRASAGATRGCSGSPWSAAARTTSTRRA